MSIPLKSAVLNYKPPKPMLQMAMLSHKTVKKKPIGFAGGNNKLKEVFNNADYIIENSDDDSINETPLPKPRSYPKRAPLKPATVYISDNVKLRGSTVPAPVSIERERDESEQESSIDESREGEDMNRFCKRINKMTLHQMRLDQKKQNDRVAKKLSAQTILKDKILKDFRKRVKDNLYSGKMILFTYEKDEMVSSYSINDILMIPLGNSLLKQITEEVAPFRLLHYFDGNYKIEVTWAVPSAKDPTGHTNNITKTKKTGPPPPNIQF